MQQISRQTPAVHRPLVEEEEHTHPLNNKYQTLQSSCGKKNLVFLKNVKEEKEAALNPERYTGLQHPRRYCINLRLSRFP
jgi:hypothetical protein